MTNAIGKRQPFDVHAQYVCCGLPRLLWGIAKLNATRFAASANVDLGFNDNRPAQFAGNGFGLLWCAGYTSGLNRNTVAGQKSFGLIFVHLHCTNSFFTLLSCSPGPPGWNRYRHPAVGGPSEVPSAHG